MPRVVLVHWKEAEIELRAAKLREAGFDATPFSADGAEVTRKSAMSPPAAYVIDLSRLPSHGRQVALALRQQKATRNIPLVFVDGEPEKIERVRKELPDATYTTWRGVGGALKKAIARPKNTVVVPPMAGYSGTPLPKKLGVDGNRSIILLHAPKGFEDLIRDGAGGQKIKRGDRGQADVVIWFVKQRSELEERMDAAIAAIAEGGGMWIAWPKKASGVVTDITEDAVRNTGLANRLVDYKVCAIDETWSGLKFARRKK